MPPDPLQEVQHRADQRQHPQRRDGDGCDAWLHRRLLNASPRRDGHCQRRRSDRRGRDSYSFLRENTRQG
jgi:hypothetical protein